MRICFFDFFGLNYFQRYQKLWFDKSKDLAEDADKKIIKLSEEMSLGIVHADERPMDGEEEKLLVDEDEDDQSYNFGNLSTSSQAAHSRTQVHDMEAFSAERELTNFLTGSNSHFQNCELIQR